jgi:hypothetical protein
MKTALRATRQQFCLELHHFAFELFTILIFIPWATIRED